MDDIKAIEEVVANYWKGSNTHDSAILSSVFYEEALVSGLHEGQFLTIPAPAFVDVVCSEDPSPEAAGCNFRCQADTPIVDGNMATVRFLEFDDNGTDYITNFQLLKRDGIWKVIAKCYITV